MLLHVFLLISEDIFSQLKTSDSLFHHIHLYTIQDRYYSNSDTRQAKSLKGLKTKIKIRHI